MEKHKNAARRAAFLRNERYFPRCHSFQKGGISKAVKIICLFRQDLRGAGSVKRLDLVGKAEDFGFVCIEGDKGFLPVFQDQAYMLTLVAHRPVDAVGAAADINFTQVVIRDQGMAAAGKHLAVRRITRNMVFCERFEQLQGRCADSGGIFHHCAADDGGGMAVKTQVMGVIFGS